MEYPLTSALTPTCNRRGFFPRAVRCFLCQDYPNLEWIILDDGEEPVSDLIPVDPRIKYFRVSERQNHGAKMNACFELARGPFGIVFDDDDWYPASRVTRQIIPMLENPAVNVTGTSTLYYYRHGEQTAYRYTSPRSTKWLASIAIRRSAWLSNRFDSIPEGADYNFQKQMPDGTKVDLFEAGLVVASIHAANAGRKTLDSDYKPEPWETIQKLWNAADLR